MSEMNREPAQQEDISELLQIRRDKLTQLQEAGQDPFVLTKYPVDSHAAPVREKYEHLQPEEEAGTTVAPIFSSP